MAMCRSYGVRSCAGVMLRGIACRGYASYPGWFAFTNRRSLTVQTFWAKCRCQLVVKLKANKYYPELLSFLSSYVNLQDLKASPVGSWPLAGSKPLAPDPDLRPLAILVLVFAFGQLFLDKVCCNPTDFRWVNCFVTIRPHLAYDCLIVLGLSFGLLLNWLFLTLFICDFGPLRNCSRLSSASPSSRLLGLPSNCARPCIIILEYSRFCQAVVCRFCWVIVCDFGGLVRRSVPWSYSCKLFLTIGSSNCKRSKTKSIFK